MNSFDLRSLLNSYVPSCKAEARDSARMLSFLGAHPDCFERSCKPGHFTGSAWLINATGDSVLLTHHKKLGRWLQPGGHADGDSDLLRVSLREASEESGIDEIEPAAPGIFDIDIHEIPEHKGIPAHLHYDVRFALRALSDKFVVSDESTALAWVPLKRLEEYTLEDSLLRMRAKWIKHSVGTAP